MDKEALKLIREMLIEELDPIKNDIKELKEELEPIKNDIKELKKGQDRLEIGQSRLEVRLDRLEIGQEEIKTLISELDPKNANRHLELKDSIDDLKRDLSTVEIVTASNYADIAKLKRVE